MKALILAAGFGTRLKPFTDHTPKPLFPIGGIALLDRMIDNLGSIGCQEILVNTHHLGDRIQAHVAARQYPIPVYTRHEPEILGTGGAIKNAADFLDDRPFFVINADIVTDIDLGSVYRFHATHPHPVSLVLVDDPTFNTVQVDGNDNVVGFGDNPDTLDGPAPGRLTFSGIQVLDRVCLDFIPPGVFSHSIAAYTRMMASGLGVKAYVVDNARWNDLGTPERYTAAVADELAAAAFEKPCPEGRAGRMRHTRLKGDGSDRRWHRVVSGSRSVIMVDHGIRQRPGVTEADAFVRIGSHLFAKGVPVPKILAHDTFAGIVVVEDLGDTHFQDVIRAHTGRAALTADYQRVIDELIRMSVSGAEGFDPAWAYQTGAYTREVILTLECRYFVESFLMGYLGLPVRFEDLAEEFTALADRAADCFLNGFMHRDFQSRNIMVRDGRCYFIDFQGGRTGPLQYDLASLLIDPYVALDREIRDTLVNYCVEKLQSAAGLDADRFRAGFEYCALTRNLQILGAFGYLTRVKGKAGFEAYIPAALKTLQATLSKIDTSRLTLLKKTIDGLHRQVIACARPDRRPHGS